MLGSQFYSFLAISRLVRVVVAQDMYYVLVVAQDMWLWWRRICGGSGAGYVVVVAQDMWWGKSKLKLTQPS
jgi:hypothetical protein